MKIDFFFYLRNADHIGCIFYTATTIGLKMKIARESNKKK